MRHSCPQERYSVFHITLPEQPLAPWPSSAYASVHSAGPASRGFKESAQSGVRPASALYPQVCPLGSSPALVALEELWKKVGGTPFPIGSYRD